MEKKTLILKPSFYTSSPYAKYVISEEHDDSYGLIYNEFLHEIGTMLEADIIFDHVKKTDWVIADNPHLQITYLKDTENNDQFDFIPKTDRGEKLIHNMTEKISQDNGRYIYFQ